MFVGKAKCMRCPAEGTKCPRRRQESYTRSLETGSKNPPFHTNGADSAAAASPVNLVRPNSVLLTENNFTGDNGSRHTGLMLH